MTGSWHYLSYIVDESTPTYGNRDQFKRTKQSTIESGDVANNTHISTTSHIGTHIDMPYHFFEHGQTIQDFKADFWFFTQPLIIELTPKDHVIYDELNDALANIPDTNTYDCLIVKTGLCNRRNTTDYGDKNVGFSPKLASIIRNKLPHVRLFGFDSVSVSSFQERMIGREAHREFLNPESPIILLEDMDLTAIYSSTNIQQLIVSPFRIHQCDGIPVTVLALI